MRGNYPNAKITATTNPMSATESNMAADARRQRASISPTWAWCSWFIDIAQFGPTPGQALQGGRAPGLTSPGGDQGWLLRQRETSEAKFLPVVEGIVGKKRNLEAEARAWRRHNEPPHMSNKRAEETRKRAERRNAEAIGRKHVAFRSESVETVDDILRFIDVDFGPDSAKNAERLYSYIAEGRLRLIRRQEIAYTERQNFAHVGALVRDADKAADLDKFWGVKGKGAKPKSAKLDAALAAVESMTKALEIYDSYLPPMAKPTHGPCRQISSEEWPKIVRPDKAEE